MLIEKLLEVFSEWGITGEYASKDAILYVLTGQEKEQVFNIFCAEHVNISHHALFAHSIRPGSEAEVKQFLKHLNYGQFNGHYYWDECTRSVAYYCAHPLSRQKSETDDQVLWQIGKHAASVLPAHSLWLQRMETELVR